jgi:hypothetical protein
MRTRRIVTASTIVLVALACLALAGAKGLVPLGPLHLAAQKASSSSPGVSPAAPPAPPASSPAAASSSASSTSYSTPEPGPGCDKNGATWAENSVQFSSGCEVEATTQNQYGFMNVTLPGSRAFAQDNSVSITGALGNSGDGYDSACLGLEEDGSAAGYLAAYCNNGDWYVYTTSGEVIGHQLTTGSIPMGVNGTTYQMVLSLSGSTLSLTFNNVNAPGVFKVATLQIASFQPTQVGIGYQYGGYQVPAPATNFTYTEQ